MTDTPKAPAKKANHLLHEQSPYLLQHAYNPVDWYPWGEEAFAKAKAEDKPIFLSIGYATCHWCHVMEHESFEDPEVSKLMNDTFVSIKVDREERPDIDGIYMQVCQMLTGSGGWPLTILMTPEKVPFYAGTYFPKQSLPGRIGMLALIPQIKHLWENDRNRVTTATTEIAKLVEVNRGSAPPGAPLAAPLLAKAYEQLSDRFDAEQGGFGHAPKFPTPHNLMFLLRYWKRTREPQALEMVEKTLRAIRHGGIFDHIGFGFHRYATDAKWLVPHFEKMLYDQAMLAMAYTETFQATGDPFYRQVAEEIFAYVLRDMTDSTGGFYSAEDADSEGEEGKFYVWTEDEISNLLQEDAPLFLSVFNTLPAGNFAEEASGKKDGSNILHLQKSIADLARAQGIPEAELSSKIGRARETLFAVREKRIHPEKDDKILTDWNGLMIAALAKAGRAFQEPKYTEAAIHATAFLQRHLKTGDGRLLHRFRKGDAAIPAYLDDYAFFTWGLLELYQTTFETSFLKEALRLTQVSIDYFWDEAHGGFFFTADDSEKLLTRRKESYDGAIPSGNGVAMLNLLRLGRITAQPELEQKAIALGSAFSESIQSAPMAFTQFLQAVAFLVGPSYEVVIAGNPDTADTRTMLTTLFGSYHPNKVVVLRPSNQGQGGEAPFPDIVSLAPYTKEQISLNGQATAYVCQNYACQLPTTDPNQMLSVLSAR